ncbi:HNH endonuclease signature motif containing protein [Promicromonospora iranensis]|uniref:HNH nuclease domain-containing protein n=1 Tax=Promicromonospora iranensis TaxID=1105144 RepID=A0ABU2CUD0_9MICO|nr:HNH endonuclease signature motif containing protein [Promicromonospora iranensis]MDR7384951.1 hypothetical protein [Promicromonospora iranensis]
MEQSTSTDGVPGPGLPSAESIEETLARFENMMDELAVLTDPEVLDGWDAPTVGRLMEAHTRIRSLTGRLDGVRCTLLSRIEADGSWRSGGMARAFTTWLRIREGISATTAGKDMTMARRLATALPGTRERLVAGTLGIDHARVMTKVAPTSETRQDALAWLIDTRTGERTTPEAFVQTVPVDFPDPAQDPDGAHTRQLITQVLEDAVTKGTLVTGEGLVLREAGSLNADQFRIVARRFATITDPDTDDVDDDKAALGEFLDLAKTFGGYHLAGFLTDEHGLLVTAAINAILGAPSAEDTRTSTQRRAQGLADVARIVLDTNQASPGAAIPPHLNVTVSWTELVAQATRTRDGLCLTCGQTAPGRTTGTGAPSTGAPGTGAGAPGTGTGTGVADTGTGPGPAGTMTVSALLSGGGPVFTETGDRAPRALLRRLACDSAVTRIVFGPDGAVLDVGRAQRTVSGQMRRAVIARDQHCVFPGCDQPPSRCEVHHAVTHWAHGGNTSVSNSALLCWYHHQLVDTRGITMHWTGKPTTTGTTTADSTTGTTTSATAPGALIETGWAFTDARGHRITLPEPIEALPPPEAEAA